MTTNGKTTHTHEYRRRLREAAVDLYSQMGFLDPADLLGDSFWWADVPVIPPYRRQSQGRGEVLPVYTTEEQLRVIRDRSRRLCAENEFAICAVENRRNYAVGSGIPAHAVPASENPTDADRELCRRANVVLAALWRSASVPARQSDAMHRLDRDGEFFVRSFERPSGLLDLRAVEPEHVRAPSGDGIQSPDGMGIRCDPDDVETVLGYWIVPHPILSPQPGLVPAREVVHAKLNVDLAAKRGLPTFYPVESNLRRAEDLLASMTSVAKARAKIAMIRKVKGAVAGAAQSLVDSLTNVKMTDPVTQEQLNLERMRWGSILTSSDQVEHEFPAADVDAAAFVAVLQAELRAVAARLQMPEWMLTVDASNANLASSLVAEAPSTKAFERLQNLIAWHFCDGPDSIAWRQIRYSVRLGVLSPETLQRVKVQAEPPSLVVRDRQQEANVNAIYLRARVKDRKTIQQEQGLDPAKVDANFRADGIDPTKPEQLPAREPGGQGQGPAAGQGLRTLATEAKDASGHDHANDGKFTGPGHETLHKAATAYHSLPKADRATKGRELYAAARTEIASKIASDLSARVPAAADAVAEASGIPADKIRPAVERAVSRAAKSAAASAVDNLKNDAGLLAQHHRAGEHDDFRSLTASAAESANISDSDLHDAFDTTLVNLSERWEEKEWSRRGIDRLSGQEQQSAIAQLRRDREAYEDGVNKALSSALLPAREVSESKDAKGKEHKGKGPGGGQFTSQDNGGGSGGANGKGGTNNGADNGPKDRQDKPKTEKKPTSRAGSTRKQPVSKRTQHTDRYTSTAVRRRVLHGLRNEAELAKALSGHNLPDSEPADVVVIQTPEGQLLTDHAEVMAHLSKREAILRRLKDKGLSEEGRKQYQDYIDSHKVRFFEVKTLIIQQGEGKVAMSSKAVNRKKRWEKRYGAEFVTVAFDDRKGKKHSGHRLYFKKGVGSAKLSDMQKAGSFDEVMT